MFMPMKNKTAIITGITGQDGAYLANFLLNKGYTVYGGIRRTSSVNTWRLVELNVSDDCNFHLIDLDITDLSSCIRALQYSQPDEFYNLAAQSFVGTSFDQPLATAQITGLGAACVLEAIRLVKPDTRFYQASSSEMYGQAQIIPQNEETDFYPRSPYAVAKLYAHWMTVNYRESYDIFAVSGILFNHESPLRGKEFVTRKITDGIARIKSGNAYVLELGNLNAKRDWGFAGDYVDGMWKMLQQDQPDNYVLATGQTHKVRDFVNKTCHAADIDISWHGNGKDEYGINSYTGETIVRVNPEFYRPAEVDLLIGDPAKAEEKLGWVATTNLEELCRMMYQADLSRYADNSSC